MSMKQNKGFTLVELIIVIVIVGIISGFGALALEMAAKSINKNKELLEITWQSQIVFQRLERELREAKAILDSSNLRQIRFKVTNNRVIRYRYRTNQNRLDLQRRYERNNGNAIENWTALAKNISDLRFTYYDENFNTTSTESNAKCVTVSATFTKDGTSVPFQTTICPRNL